MISTRLKNALAEKISTFCKHCVGDKLPFGQVQLPGYGAVAPGSCLVVGLCCARLSLSLSLSLLLAQICPLVLSALESSSSYFLCASPYTQFIKCQCVCVRGCNVSKVHTTLRTLHAFPHKGCSSEHSKTASQGIFQQARATNTTRFRVCQSIFCRALVSTY
jgi:hypothetical protein